VKIEFCSFLIRSLLLTFLAVSITYADDLDGVKLHSTAPVRYSNNDRLINPRSELKAYRIYYAAERENIRARYLSVSPEALSFPLQQIDRSKLISPIIYLAMIAVSVNGQESEPDFE